MARYFLAIPIAHHAKDRLVAIQPPQVPGMRLIGRDEFHLTLHFLGELAPDRFAAASETLRRLRMPAFTIAIEGIGLFPPEGSPGVLWAGVRESPSLRELHRQVGDSLASAIGYQGEARAYQPHITLARLPSAMPLDALNGYLTANRGFLAPPMTVDRIVLFSSEFQDGRPCYREEGVFQFSRGASPS
jgi:2'-5' RNA ligase